ncbi:MAG: 30S ribosomal protein S12 methylthiotransferase RimO [Bacillota bacterium]
MTGTVHLVSLGCAKNRIDSEEMLASLAQAGFVLTGEAREADIIVVNTCAFVNEAKREAIGVILELAEAKRHGRCRALLVAGCLPQRYAADLLHDLPEVDGVVGVEGGPRIVQAVERALGGERPGVVDAPGCIQAEAGSPPRLLTTPKGYAYLRIADGCDHRCGYCVIPDIRGRYRSRRPEHILAEARQLVGMGVKELVLVAQDSSGYGHDLPGPATLAALLRDLEDVGAAWLRVLYLHPAGITAGLLDAFAHGRRLLPYFDLPLQHVSASVLRAMGRAGDRPRMEALIRDIRAAVPGAVLRSTFISGHPGETAADHAELLDFISAARLDHVGVFAYSREEGTRSAARADQVPAAVARRRRGQLLRAQQPIALAHNQALIGRVLTVLVERDGPAGWGRLGRQAPEADGAVQLADCPAGLAGRIVEAQITAASAYDLHARVLPAASQP